jgi:two-component system, NarL family, response regulator LiaR
MVPATAQRLRVFLAEDHAVVREGTRQILDTDASLDVVGEADDGLQTVALVTELRPDIVLLDLGLPGLNGIEVARQLRVLDPAPRVLFLSAYDDVDYVIAATEAGAAGYLLKTAHTSAVIAAIHAAARGEIILDAGLARKLAARASEGSARKDKLTRHEHDVLSQAAHGLHNREIADRMGVSVRTVETHLTNIFNKLGVASRTEAIVRASQMGWVTLDDPPLPRIANRYGEQQ